MKAECKALLALELRALCGWNKYRYGRDTKEKNRWRLLAAVWALLAVLAAGYVGGTVWGLVALGAVDAAPAVLVMLAAVTVFLLGLFKAGGLLFGAHGYDMLCAMPLDTGSIVLARCCGMYLRDLALTALVLLPGTAVYGVLLRPGAGFYAAMLAGTLLTPLLPGALSVLAGTLVQAAAVRFKHRAAVETVLLLALLFLSLAGSMGLGFTAEAVTEEQLLQLAAGLLARVSGVYPPALWLAKAAVEGSWGHFALFAAVSLAAAGAMLALVARLFAPVSRALAVTAAGSHYRMAAQKCTALPRALLQREAKRYFASSAYVTNTVAGPIMGAVMAAGLLFAGVDTVTAPLAGALPGANIAALAPCLLAAACSMMPPTAVSLSLEGPRIRILQAMPLPLADLLRAKLRFALALQAPFYLLSQLLLTLALAPTLPQLFWQLTAPAVYIAFSVVWGLAVDVRLHRFDWPSEVAMVKQSSSAALGGMPGALLPLAAAALTLTGSAWPPVLFTLAVAAAAAGLYRWVTARTWADALREAQ